MTNLFCKLAGVNKDSIVFDNCCGTGGFLVAAMQTMIEDARLDTDKIKAIKANQLMGIEYQDDIYPLACSNMIIHGDGKTNLLKGDCFERSHELKNKKPDIGLQNPPYATSKTDTEEFEFTLNLLENIQKNGKVITLVPMSCALAQKGVGFLLKERLLEKHTLEAVVSLPDDLFHNSKVGVVTCALVFTAHQPHPKGKKSYFGYWKDDGFRKIKNKGRVDADEKWKDIEKSWVNSYQNKEAIAGFSVMEEVDASMEWCAEAYMETDYSKLTEEDFIQTIKKYVAFQFLHSDKGE